METRVIRLEERSDVFEARLGRIEDKLDHIIERLARVPTFEAMIGYSIVTATALIAVAGVLVGAMGWLETRAGRVAPAASAQQPIIIQLPASPTATTPAKPPLPR